MVRGWTAQLVAMALAGAAVMRGALAVFLLALAVAPTPAAGASAALESALRPLEPLARTGVLYDRVLPLAHLERLDGGAAAPVVDLATWRQAYDELRRASIAPPAGPDLAALETAARAAARAGVIP